jgi:hypothetical protein
MEEVVDVGMSKLSSSFAVILNSGGDSFRRTEGGLHVTPPQEGKSQTGNDFYAIALS